MPPKFMKSCFDFNEGETVPEHIEEYPRSEEHKPSKIRLLEWDSFSNEYYPLAINIEDFPTAKFLKIARDRQIERTQSIAGDLSDKSVIREPSTKLTY